MRSILIPLILCAFPVAAPALTIHVPADQPTIQAAINVSVDGDEIVLADQTYTGDGNRNLIIHGRAITIRSAGDDPTACVIDIQGSILAGRAFVFTFDETPATVIRGIGMIDGFNGTSSQSDGQGGAIYAHNASPRFENCRVTSCTANGHWSADGFGGGVFLLDSDAEFVDCEFTLNHAATEGGAVSVRSGAPTFTRCRFAENTTAWGGAVRCRGGVTTFADCVFENHETTGSGGAIYAHTAAVLVCEGTRFQNNGTWVPSGAGAGAIDGDYSVSGTFRHCEFLDNHASYAGGAVVIGNSTFEDCVFAGNTALPNPGDYGGYGGALSCFFETTITRCTFAGNAAVSGSAIHWTGADPLTITESILCDGVGSGVLFCGTPGDLTVTCTDSHGNEDGDWTGCLEGFGTSDGNLSADPQFCGVPGSHIYNLQTDSPCAPANNTCLTRIGARPVNCGLTPVFLSGIDFATDGGRVQVSWETGEDLDAAAFALEAAMGDVVWSVPVTRDRPGAYRAVDAATQLLAGGTVTYVLSYEDGDDRVHLAHRTVELTPPRGGLVVVGVTPNPFNPATRLDFVLTRPDHVKVTVHDLQGRRIRTLADRAFPAGVHAAVWRGWDDEGRPATSGAYFLRVETPREVRSVKAALVR